jgi:hypothetical protein
MSMEKLKKMHSMCKSKSVAEAVAEIKGSAGVNEVMPEVAPDKRDDVLEALRASGGHSMEKSKGEVAGEPPEGKETKLQTEDMHTEKKPKETPTAIKKKP